MKFIAKMFTKKLPQEHKPVYNAYFAADKFHIGDQVYHKQHKTCIVINVMSRYSTRGQVTIKTKKGLTYNVSPASIEHIFTR